MGLILTVTAGLCIWVVLWAFGIKGFDAFLITAVMSLFAVAARNVLPFRAGPRE